MNQSFFVKTYGCQMNDYDSEKIDELLLHSGFTKVSNFEKSHRYLVKNGFVLIKKFRFPTLHFEDRLYLNKSKLKIK